MKTYRVLQMGLGSFGESWLQEVIPQVAEASLCGVVTRRGDWAAAAFDLPRECVYADLTEALDQLKPDVLLNVTPPNVHRAVTLAALHRGVPVLCEKPIAETMEDALALAEEADQCGARLTIAENYRYFNSMQRLHDIVASGVLGRLDAVYLDFFRAHEMGEENYHNTLRQPMLLDISVHHFDCLRFVLCDELKTVTAKTWTPPWSHYRSGANVSAELSTASGTRVFYHGGLACTFSQTDWLGNWRAVGERGCVAREEGRIVLLAKEGQQVIPVPEEGESRVRLMKDFLVSLEHGVPSPTDIHDNLRSFAAVQQAIRSAEAAEETPGKS